MGQYGISIVIWRNVFQYAVQMYFPLIYEGDSNETHSGIVLGKGVEAIE
jgi:hypothetical protein